MEGYRMVVTGIVERDGQVLIGKKKHVPGHFLSDEWHVPGGKTAPGETNEQAIIREMREDTGLEVKVMSFVDEKVDHEAKRRVSWYMCTELSGDLRASDDLVDVKFVPRKEVLSQVSQVGISLMPPKVLEYFRN